MGEEVYEVVKGLGVYSDIEKNHTVSGSEDCSYFMSRVQDHGGKAVYMLYGTEEASGHHTSEFDFNEDVLPLSVYQQSGSCFGGRIFASCLGWIRDTKLSEHQKNDCTTGNPL